MLYVNTIPNIYIEKEEKKKNRKIQYKYTCLRIRAKNYDDFCLAKRKEIKWREEKERKMLAECIVRIYICEYMETPTQCVSKIEAK